MCISIRSVIKCHPLTNNVIQMQHPRVGYTRQTAKTKPGIVVETGKSTSNLCSINSPKYQSSSSNKDLSPTATATANAISLTKILCSAIRSQPITAEARCCPTNAWTNIYNNAVNWQYQYQSDFWKSVANRRQLENEELRQRVEMLEASLTRTEAVQQSTDAADENESITSSSDKESETRESFLTFMEISTRHQIQKQLEQQELDRYYE